MTVEQQPSQRFLDHHLARMLFASAERFASRPATRVLAGDGSWHVQTYQAFAHRIRHIAAGLAAQGIQPGDRVALYSGNRPEWSEVDFAVLANGAIVVPVFATSSVDEVRHILTDSGARLVVVAGAREAERVRATGLELPLVSFDPAEGAMGLDELASQVTPELFAEVERRTAAGRGDDVATIVYTSGTTGPAKGVMLTHGGFGNQQDAIDDCWDFDEFDCSVSFLPLAHSLERDWSFHVFHVGALNTYCTDPKTIGELLPKAQPTCLVSVPMLFEKVMAGVFEAAASPAQRRTLEWALRVGGQCQRAYRKGKEPARYWRTQLPLADRLVLSRIRAAVGGNKKLMVSGGAPLRREVEEFFSAAGILLGQGYGLTESGPMMTIYRPDRYKLGTVGFTIKGNRMAIGDGGEILVSGPSVMKGYWGQPEQTAQVLVDGWLHTGDVGHVDADGFVTITDRMKDIIVTRNGKNVAPQAVEAALLADPRLEQAVVVGDDRPCLVAVVQPTAVALQQWADELGLEGAPDEVVRHPALRDLLAGLASQLTADLAHHEQVRGVVPVSNLITMSSGLVTSTMKVRRGRVEQRLRAEIDASYARIAAARRR